MKNVCIGDLYQDWTFDMQGLIFHIELRCDQQGLADLRFVGVRIINEGL